MWIFYAFVSAFFAGITAILAKCGIRCTDSTVATAIRTVVVLIFAWIMVFIVGSQDNISELSRHNLIFLILSGLATGASWLCYFYALQRGPIDKVVPIDKTSTILTMLLAALLLREDIGAWKIAAIVLIALGTFMMLEKHPQEHSSTKQGWFLAALGSAVFASLTAILGKIGIVGVESNLGTAIRTIVVLFMAWGMVFIKHKQKFVSTISAKEFIFICLSGIATGASWLCYYKALQTGLASIVVPIDKLSILITVTFSYFVFKEKLSLKAFTGLVILVAGTLLTLY